jgi:hypothetical protein
MVSVCPFKTLEGLGIEGACPSHQAPTINANKTTGAHLQAIELAVVKKKKPDRLLEYILNSGMIN